MLWTLGSERGGHPEGWQQQRLRAGQLVRQQQSERLGCLLPLLLGMVARQQRREDGV